MDDMDTMDEMDISVKEGGIPAPRLVHLVHQF